MKTRAWKMLLIAGVAAAGASVATAGIMDKVGKVAKTAKKLNVQIDEEQERWMGRTVAANLVAKFGLVEDPGLVQYVSMVGNWLASRSERPELPYRFAVLDTDQVNAFAAPGGYIFVTRGALAALKDESELAGVLGHEIIHVTARHGVKSVEDAYRKKAIVSTAAEEGARAAGVDPRLVGLFGELTDAITETLLVKGYSRKLELEADAEGLRLAASTGYDGEGIVRFARRLAGSAPKGSGPGMLGKTHPAPQERVKALEKEISGHSDWSRPDARYAEQFAKATGAKPAKG